MKYKKTIIISVIVLAISFILIALSNSTYALFSVDDYGDNPNSYSTGMLDIQAISKSENISLTNALPMTDDEGVETTPYVFTIKNTGNLDYKFSIKLLSTGTSDTTFSSQYIKLQVDDGDVLTLSDLTNSVIKSDITLPVGESIDVSLRIWLSIETPNTELGKSFNSKIVTDGQAVYTSTSYTPLSDFAYYLGSEYSTVDTIAAADVASFSGNISSDIELNPISLEQNEVLLIRYKGESKDVIVPNTYIVDGVSYNVIVLSSAGSNFGSAGTFMYNNNIKSVLFGNDIRFIDQFYSSTINNSWRALFMACTNLISVPIIPDSITDIGEAFSGCTSLVNVPVIPNSVGDMASTFEGCTSLVSIPEIPASVIDMSNTFSGCTNLTGTVRINASNVTEATYIFDDTSKAITVEVPAGSTTYTNISALTTSNGMPSNVTLKTFTPLSDFAYYLGSEYSTLEEITSYDIYSEEEEEIKVSPISLEENEVLLVRYNGESTDVAIPDTYNVDGVNYNVVLLSYAWYEEDTADGYLTGETGVLLQTNIKSVYFDDNISFIESNYVKWDMDGDNVVDETNISLSENSMSLMFGGTTNLINVPNIPSSVTRMSETFMDCTNLTGTVRINSSNVTDVKEIFTGTSKDITVEVPAGSTTYNTFESSSLPSNVTLKTY